MQPGPVDRDRPGPAAAASATIRLHRPSRGWREDRGGMFLRIDGREHGPLRAGESLDVEVRAGRHDVQAGRTGRSTSPVLHVPVADGDLSVVRLEPGHGSLGERTAYRDGIHRLVGEAPGVGETGPPTQWTGRRLDLSLRGNLLRLGLLALFVFSFFFSARLLHPLGTTGYVLWWILRGAVLVVGIAFFWRTARYRPDPDARDPAKQAPPS